MRDSFERRLNVALVAEVPQRPVDFFDRLDDVLNEAAPKVDGTTIDEAAMGGVVPHGATDMTIDAPGATGKRERVDPRRGGPVRTRRRRRWVVAAAAIAAMGLAVAMLASLGTRSSGRVDTGVADRPDLEVGPVQNLDRWNAIYAVWDCTAGDGDGAWLPPFQSMVDDVGIHSHGDGLISIHPFFESSAGRNATFSHFAASMGISVSPEAIVLDDGRVLAAGADCGGKAAVVQIRRWSSAFALEDDPLLPPVVVTEGFGAERFRNDLEVWVIALAPLDADLPLPPQERFDALAEWWSRPPNPG